MTKGYTGQASILSNNTPRPHQSLARRILFPNHSGELPPLLATSNTPPELHAELYDFIALALRAYINPWWTKITRYDKEFLPQITRILIIVIRALESRLLALDLPPLLFHDVPIILTQHYRDYRNAASKLSSSYATGGAASLPHLFHHLQPHIALSPDAAIDLQYYRQIVDHILRACLPPEDYEPEAERFIVREVILKVLVEDVIPKITQPWFIQKSILDLLGSDEDRLFKTSEPPSEPPSNSFSFHTFIVIVLSALQSFSTTCLALIHLYKQAVSTIKLVNRSPAHTPRSTTPLPQQQQTTFHETQPSSSSTQLHSQIPSKTPSISPTSSTMSSVSYPSRSIFPPSREMPITPIQPSASQSNSHQIPQRQYENYSSPPLALLSEVFLTTERLAATSLMNLLGMISASMTPFLDKLLPHLLYATLSPGFFLNLVRLSKKTMFPNGFPGLPPVEPTVEEQAALRRKLVEWRGNGGLSHLAPLFLGADPKQTLNAAIDPLTSQSCNVHLIVILLDRLLVGLFPELISGATTLKTPSVYVTPEAQDTGSSGNDVDPIAFHADNIIPNLVGCHDTLVGTLVGKGNGDGSGDGHNPIC